MCPPGDIHVCHRVYGHVAAIGRAHRPSPTVFSFLFRVEVYIHVCGHIAVIRADAGVRPYRYGLHRDTALRIIIFSYPLLTFSGIKRMV